MDKEEWIPNSWSESFFIYNYLMIKSLISKERYSTQNLIHLIKGSFFPFFSYRVSFEIIGIQRTLRHFKNRQNVHKEEFMFTVVTT